jgi:hypothetical protein
LSTSLANLHTYTTLRAHGSSIGNYNCNYNYNYGSNNNNGDGAVGSDQDDGQAIKHNDQPTSAGSRWALSSAVVLLIVHGNTNKAPRSRAPTDARRCLAANSRLAFH